jgi:tryptophan 2,3-dioxygenase
MALTYSNYLKLQELMALQQPLSGGNAHDEMLFIIIHQVYELWFKETLHELDHLRSVLAAPDFPRAQLTLKRIGAIVKVLITQLDVLETMLPLDFLAFRSRLGTASGFQSVQFRELEFALGHKRREVCERLPAGSEARQRLEQRFRDATLWDAFLEGLARSGYPMPDDLRKRDVTQPIAPSPRVQGVLIEIYSSSPGMVCLCEMLLDVDEGLQEWRYRHVKMVERMIGEKHGTGGSEGVGYLKSTLFRPFFPDLWAVRTELQAK